MFFALAIFGIGLAGTLAGAGIVFLSLLGLVALHALWQLKRLDTEDPDICLMLFRANRDFGWLVFAAILADVAVSKLI